jgi:putative peptidoglycan lipid II flippase
VLNKVFSPGYFAREDTVTPMWFAGIGMVVNVVGALALRPFCKHVGIALATTLAGWVNTGLLGIVLWRREHFSPDTRIFRKLVLILVASLLMGVILHFRPVGLKDWLFGPALPIRAAALAALLLVGMASFGLFAQVTAASNLIGHVKSLKRRNT